MAFAVHLPNPLRRLTRPQVRDIYGGSVTDWGQVGGLPAPIIGLVHRHDAPPAVHRFVQFATRPAARRVLDTYGYVAAER